jgi:type VII secretion integral membrane protein EccD
MPAYSRVTLIGDRYRVDAVVPSDEPVGRLMPDLLRLVGDGVESPPRLRHLVGRDGRVLSSEHTLAGSYVTDGSVLVLARAEDTPPAPVVHDLTEEAAGDLDGRAWRWGPDARRWTATVATVGLMATAGLVSRTVVEDGAAAAGLLAAAAALVVTLGALIGWARPTPVATALALGGGALAVVAIWTAADTSDWEVGARAGGIVAVTAFVLAVLGAMSPLGQGGAIGSAAASLLGLAWVAGVAVGLSTTELAAVMSVIAGLALGLLPRLALTASGLAALDDRRASGASVARYEVDRALAANHRGLVTATLVVALSAALSGGLLARDLNPWTASLAGLTALVLAGRSRLFPLVPQVVGLQAAVAAIGAALFAAWVVDTPDARPAQVGVAAATALVPLVALAADPPEHVRARLRRVTDWVEAAAVIALIPVAIGVFGTYERLLDVYG